MTTTDSTERAKALEQALGQIEKHYGKGAIMRLGADEKIWMWRSSPPAASPWTWPWASAASPGAG